VDKTESWRSSVPTGLPEAVIDVPDVRDYQRINAELIQLLDQGIRRIRLIGVESQRLLLAGLCGSWSATIEIEGNAGPELAAGLNAPDLKIVCLGSAADGAGSNLVGGQLLILGNAGVCTGVSQQGGSIIIAGSTAERAGLNQRGGILLLLGKVQALAGERQMGGTLVAQNRLLGPQVGRGRRGGQLVRFEEPVQAVDASLLRKTLAPFHPWLTLDTLGAAIFDQAEVS